MGLSAARSHLLNHLNTKNYNCLDCDLVYTSNCYRAKHSLIRLQKVGETSQGKMYKYYSAPQLLRNENLNRVQTGYGNNNNNVIPNRNSKPDEVVEAPLYAGVVTENGTVSLVPTQIVVRTKNPTYPIVCLECHQTFPDKKNLQSHSSLVHGKRSAHICPHCNMIFQRERRLKAHMKTYKAQGCELHICTFCNKIFKKASRLKFHMSSHTGRGLFECRQCGKLWKTQSILTRHLETHIKEKRFLCSVCNKHFASAYSLKIHMNIHTGERTFPCPLCSKVYSEKRFLRVHMCIHTGEGSFICQICSKKFYSSSQLKLHMCKHTGERPQFF
ncbi:gastrula zinc finger protein xLCGF3.1-like [Ruditapes philippinarum]|uniref:gastrula zinc finger protein xLCGF3.1-like n=1 Tax=Ruditapes philippinarum TaxID=129788 RepID=UPI00295A715B|nr:gastrula zinc finger protein xLCGF3.1-like [Ruditapes philippinarum]